MKRVTTALACMVLMSISSLAQNITSPYQIIPELYPAKTIRVAFHVIHRYSIDDTFNIPDDAEAADWWAERIDSINRYLENPAVPNYEYYQDYARDSKVRIRNIGVFHHVDSSYWKGAAIGDFYKRFVESNPDFEKFEKDSVLHSFYYGDDKWGGMAGGIPTRWGMRFKGRWRSYWHYRRYSPLGHAKDDHNYIHELGHSLGLSHNFKNSPHARDQCHGCDAKLGGYCFDMAAQPYASNNYMAKGKNVGPWGHSFTRCQQQRIIYYTHGLDQRLLGKKSDISMCAENLDTCRSFYNVNIEDSMILNYNFRAFGDLIIEEGAVFVVTSHLQMPPGSKIVVKKGALLVIDGGKISGSSCGDKTWKGVELRKGQFFWWLRKKDKRQVERGGQILLFNEGKYRTP